jgi:putative transposase
MTVLPALYTIWDTRLATRPSGISSSATVFCQPPSARRPPRGRNLFAPIWDVLVATDFFTTEVWTACGLVTYYVLFFIHVASRKVHVAGMTPHPDQHWMVQMARNATMTDWGCLQPGQYLLHDRDGKFCPAFRQTIDAAGVKRVPLPPRSPNLNAYAERWVRSVKEEALSRLILFGERALQHALTEYVTHFHQERPHQGKGNLVLMSAPAAGRQRAGSIQYSERLGGLLKYYQREAA